MPSSYINSDNIGNVYLNRVDGQVLQGELIAATGLGDFSGDAWREFFTVKFGDNRTIWTPSATSGSLANVGIRFPVTWESLTGNIQTPANTSVVGVGAVNARVNFTLGRTGHTVNTSNSTTPIASAINPPGAAASNSSVCFAVINDYALAWCSFSSTARTASSFGYLGWLRNDSGGSGGRYTGLQFPRNLSMIGVSGSHLSWVLNSTNIMQRVTIENSAGGTNLYSTNDTTLNPAINCIGDSTPLILRDAASPFSRVGMPYHLFRIPSGCVIGQIYKMQTDPDGSNKPYVICCGQWPSTASNFKVGMRIWADGYT